MSGVEQKIAERHLALAILSQGGEVNIPESLIHEVTNGNLVPNLIFERDPQTRTTVIKIDKDSLPKHVKDSLESGALGAATGGSTSPRQQPATNTVGTSGHKSRHGKSLQLAQEVAIELMLREGIGVSKVAEVLQVEQRLVQEKKDEYGIGDDRERSAAEVQVRRANFDAPAVVLPEDFDPVDARLETDALGRQVQIAGNEYVDDGEYARLPKDPSPRPTTTASGIPSPLPSPSRNQSSSSAPTRPLKAGGKIAAGALVAVDSHGRVVQVDDPDACQGNAMQPADVGDVVDVLPKDSESDRKLLMNAISGYTVGTYRAEVVYVDAKGRPVSNHTLERPDHGQVYVEPTTNQVFIYESGSDEWVEAKPPPMEEPAQEVDKLMTEALTLAENLGKSDLANRLLDMRTKHRGESGIKPRVVYGEQEAYIAPDTTHRAENLEYLKNLMAHEGNVGHYRSWFSDEMLEKMHPPEHVNCKCEPEAEREAERVRRELEQSVGYTAEAYVSEKMRKALLKGTFD